MSAAEVLRGCPFFSRVEGASRKRLVEMATRREYAKGETVFREGDPVPGVFIVAAGLVRIYKVAASGKEHVLHLCGPGSTFAEVAVLGEFACPASAEAVEPAVCVLLPAAPFTRALQQDHRLCLQILASMGIWVRSLVSLVEGLVLRDAIGRVAGYLLQSRADPGAVVALPALKKHIASHLNLTSETLSRTLRQLREEKLIREEETGLVLENVEALRQIAEGYYPRL